MSVTVQSIVSAAMREWEHWGKSTWNVTTAQKQIGHTDKEDAFAQYIIEKYCSVTRVNPTRSSIQNDEFFWSAVGMSAFMCMGGFKEDQFPFSQRHSTFIRKFVAARKVNDSSCPFWGYRAEEIGISPEVGDLVAYAYGDGITAEQAATYYDKTSLYSSHSDLVVAKRPTEIDVIGANVCDSVTMKTLPIDQDGHIADPHHHWFAVLKHRF
ncbi:MAG: DUF2272 domain-containing protein [Pseudomonas oryzihabitans]